MVRPPWFYRWLLNPLRRWAEDRAVPEASYLSQMRAWWPTKKPLPFLNLRVVRDARRKVA